MRWRQEDNRSKEPAGGDFRRHPPQGSGCSHARESRSAARPRPDDWPDSGQKPHEALQLSPRTRRRLEGSEACAVSRGLNCSIDPTTKGHDSCATRGYRSNSPHNLGCSPQRACAVGTRDDPGNYPPGGERGRQCRFCPGSSSRACDPQRSCAFEVMARRIPANFGANEPTPTASPSPATDWSLLPRAT